MFSPGTCAMLVFVAVLLGQGLFTLSSHELDRYMEFSELGTVPSMKT